MLPRIASAFGSTDSEERRSPVVTLQNLHVRNRTLPNGSNRSGRSHSVAENAKSLQHLAVIFLPDEAQHKPFS